MTTDETGKQYVYDAWNRLKVVKNSGGTTLKTYIYGAMNRRVAETASGTTTDLYYSDGWQVLEEAVSGTTSHRNAPATPRRTTSAATSTRPTAARTRRGCRGSTAADGRCARATGAGSTTSAG